jgi:hypothetical protein
MTHTATVLTLTRAEVRAGDLLLDFVGRPFFRVHRVSPAKAVGYLVFAGEFLTPGDHGVNHGGHRDGSVQVLRAYEFEGGAR